VVKTSEQCPWMHSCKKFLVILPANQPSEE
jgi:hypothetical protein